MRITNCSILAVLLVLCVGIIVRLEAQGKCCCNLLYVQFLEKKQDFVYVLYSKTNDTYSIERISVYVPKIV